VDRALCKLCRLARRGILSSMAAVGAGLCARPLLNVGIRATTQGCPYNRLIEVS
jgi:hypothetical protein